MVVAEVVVVVWSWSLGGGGKKHVREDIVVVGMLKTHTMCFPKSMACEQKEIGVLCGEDD